MNRIDQQFEFIKEIDKLKDVYRRSYLLSQTRRENSAEHSWHVSLLAMLLSEYSNTKVDVLHVIEMLLVHDIVEIDAGDTFCYDEKGNMDKMHREQKAADRIFDILPAEQAEKFIQLWKEFEDSKTPESLFANALDRLMPLIHNLNTFGRAWKENGITKNQVLERNQKIYDGSQKLWEFAKHQIFKAAEKGMFSDEV